jgi:hypothetical protein
MNEKDRAHKRLRQICLGYPGATELQFPGFTSFTAGDVAFAVFQTIRRRPALTVPLGELGRVKVLFGEGFFRTPGGEGILISCFVDQSLDWTLVARVLESSYRGTASPENIERLDALQSNEDKPKLRLVGRHRREAADFALDVKLAVYGHFAETGERPTVDEIAARIHAATDDVLKAYAQLREQRVLVLEDDGASIRMAPPFSGVPTQHVVNAQGVSYFANCAWDSLGIVAALRKPGVVYSRCEQSKKPLRLGVGVDGPEPCDWLFHCAVPAAQWWNDIVFT